MALIEIHCDGGRHGLGHLRRSSALGWAFRARGHQVRVTASSPEASALLPASPRDAGEASVSIVDLPTGVDAKLAQLRRPRVALDYFGEAAPELTVSVLERHQPLPPGKRLSGLEYAIVRPEISRLDPEKPGRGVLVIMGGGDVRGLGPKIARELANNGHEVTLIDGPLTPADTGEIEGVRRLRAPENLGALMAGCAWAVSNGGVTMTELLCLGKPVWVVPQTPDEDRLARHILQRGGLVGVGDFPRAPDSSPVRLIDGKGADRICAAVEELVS